MNWFAKLRGMTKDPPGLEYEILYLVPPAFVTGTVLFMLPSIVARVDLWLFINVAKHIDTLDTVAITLVLIHWAVLLLVGSGAFIIVHMKGLAHGADAHSSNSAERTTDQHHPPEAN